MKFIDEATITVQSGNGGRGCVSFRRERFIPKGGPDGGDGGKGGDVIMAATSQKRTLHHFSFKRHFAAQNGAAGQGSQKTGRNGEDLAIPVPVGTIVSDTETGQVLKDFTQDGETFIIARGGRGGQGNTRFKTPTHRIPRFAQPGEPGLSLTIRLDMKLLADVGIMGFPNAGKSTLISVMSSARPKVGDYPFTTLTPNLGVVKHPWGEPFVVADIPGLIEGAHAGAGLGTRFLRHIERTRLLIHLIDAAAVDADAPLSRLEAINRELATYSPDLAEKPQIVVLNKMDLPGADVAAELFQMAAGDLPILTISAAANQGIDILTKTVAERLNTQPSDSENEQQPKRLF
ncbi:GTPase ObgE [Desulfococcus sp.]|uniref:GTPase ObgE n=1 Tax=Desulfococcus sp. TaxID=2025834 RepID=UPI003593C077